MLSQPSNFISTLLFFILLFRFPRSSFSDNSPPVCPYPCLPPPTSVTNCPPPPPYTPAEPETGYPPPPETPNSFYYPPPSGYVPYNYPPPSGYVPYNYPPPYSNFPAPPPPNPILPYFPFYYNTPPLPYSSAPSVITHVGAAFLGSLALLLGFLLC